MRYDPTNSHHRTLLGQGILTLLRDRGLTKVELPNVYEDVYDFELEKHLTVRVYTSVEDGSLRTDGTDAIRVCLLYETYSGRKQSLGSETRVHRTGDVNMILVRLAERIQSAVQRSRVLPRCEKCGAPMAVSKAGNIYCADVCWNR